MLFLANEMEAINFWILWVLHGVPKYKAPHPKFSHAFWIGNYQKMDWREPEMILKVGEWSRYISQLRASNSIVSFGNETWSEDLIILTLHESDTSHWGLFATITEFFFGSCYFWNISLPKIWCGGVCSYPLSELARPS